MTLRSAVLYTCLVSCIGVGCDGDDPSSATDPATDAASVSDDPNGVPPEDANAANDPVLTDTNEPAGTGGVDGEDDCISDDECDDGDLCTGTEICNGKTGECEAGAPPQCDDGIECTVDTCDAIQGCVVDATACGCETDADCSDDNACTTDGCDLGTLTCANDAVDDGRTCDDGDACTVDDTCEAGQCAAGAPTLCDDGDVCNGTEACNPETGECEAGTALNCSDGVACSTDLCDTIGGCFSDYDSCPCIEDGDCNDDNECTDDACDPVTYTCTFIEVTDDPACGGDVCEDAIVVGPLPVMEQASTSGLSDAHSTPSEFCIGISETFGAGSPEQVWSYTPAGPQEVVKFTVEADWDFLLYASTSCQTEPSVCKGVAIGTSMVVNLISAQTHYLYVDGVDGASGPYDILIEQVPPTSLCLTSQLLDDALPLTVNGDTTSMTNDYQVPADCLGIGSETGAAGRDQVWLFVAPEEATYRFTVTPVSGDDLALYAMTNCSGTGSGCLAASNTDGVEVIEFALKAGGPAHIVVDGASNSDSGPYTLEVEKLAATEDD